MSDALKLPETLGEGERVGRGVVEGEALGLMLGESVKDTVAELDPVVDTEGEAVAPVLTVMVALGGAVPEEMLQREGEEVVDMLAETVPVEQPEERRVGEMLTVAEREVVELWHTEGVARTESSLCAVGVRVMKAVLLPVPPPPPHHPIAAAGGHQPRA